jgi:hypothetical protein
MAIGTTDLVGLIHENGSKRERTRMESAVESAHQAGASFGADLVLQEENGFELWLGSLEDALSLEALGQHKIDGILNCALEDCQLECACSRPFCGGRRRCHARGASAANGGDYTATTAVDGCRRLDREQIRELACFDADWYSTILGHDVDYLGIAALDAPGYAIEEHFSSTSPFLARCRNEGKRVLVHCVQGVNRSSAALVAFLCEGVGMQLADAVTLTSKQRGLILSNDDFLAQLVHCYGQKSCTETAFRATL